MLAETKTKAVAAVALLALLVLLNMVSHASFAHAPEGSENTWMASDASNSARKLFGNAKGHLSPKQEGVDEDKPGLEHHYMFGYGSLLNERSRKKTGKTGSSYPVVVSGIHREWDYDQEKRGMTALGVRFEKGSECSGILTLVPNYSLGAFDTREVRYTRKEIAHSDIHFFNADRSFVLKPSDKVWVYIVDKPVKPSNTLPISQSYVDVCLEGALEFGNDFAKKFITTTSNWSGPEGAHPAQTWVDDREEPLIYEKGFVAEEKLRIIDSLLEQTVPAAFAHRVPLKKAYGALKGHVEPEYRENDDFVTPHLREKKQE